MQHKIILLVPLYLMFFSRLHGGGFIHDVPRPVRNFLYAALYAAFSPLAFVAAFVGKNIGHYNFWWMGVRQSKDRDSWLASIVAMYGLERNTLAYCATGLALKGALLAAGTLNPAVIAGHAVAMPLSYYIGMKTRWGTELAEYLDGLFCGIVILVFGVKWQL